MKINWKSLGGILYNPNHVKNTQKLKNGMYQITFNTGETITYPEQAQEACISTTVIHKKNTLPLDHRVDNCNFNEFSIWNVKGATFKSSKDAVARVRVCSGENNTIDLAANNTFLYGDEALFLPESKNNTVIIDRQDSAGFAHYNKYNLHVWQSVDKRGTYKQSDYK